MQQAGLNRPRTVDIDVDRGFVARLLDARIDEAAHTTQLCKQTVRHDAIGVELVADDLDIDRRGQAEVEDLTDDVGGQEGKRDAGEIPGQSVVRSVAT